MGCGGASCADLTALCQNVLKYLGFLSFGRISHIIPEKHGLRALNDILNNSFPQVVGQRNPVNFRLSIPLKERRGCLSRRRSYGRPIEKEEIALFRSQHHIVPINHKHLVSLVADHVPRMQIGVADDVRP